MTPGPEQKLKKAIKTYLDSVNAYYAVVQGGPFSPPGAPDIIACYKSLFIGIEAKSPTGGRVSEIQKFTHKKIIDSQGIIIIARSVEDVKEVIESIDRARAMAVWDATDRKI